MDDTQPQPEAVLSKKAKLAALLMFFLVLFTIAGLVGLPLSMGVVVSFFLTLAVPLALAVTLSCLLALSFLARMTGRRGTWPLFDAGLQIFLLTALIAVGIFLVRFPTFLREGYPMLEETIVERISPEHTAAERETFLASMERFWDWNVDLLLEEGPPPEPGQPEQLQGIWEAILEGGSAPCPDCPPVMSPEETAHITQLVDKMLPPAKRETSAVPRGAPSTPTAQPEQPGLLNVPPPPANP